jgi:hypothetical protein
MLAIGYGCFQYVFPQQQGNVDYLLPDSRRVVLCNTFFLLEIGWKYWNLADELKELLQTNCG